MTITTPLNARTLSAGAAPFGGRVHGDDPFGCWDVGFDDAERAASFARFAVGQGWVADLRDPVRSLFRPVVLIVREV